MKSLLFNQIAWSWSFLPRLFPLFLSKNGRGEVSRFSLGIFSMYHVTFSVFFRQTLFRLKAYSLHNYSWTHIILARIKLKNRYTINYGWGKNWLEYTFRCVQYVIKQQCFLFLQTMFQQVAKLFHAGFVRTVASIYQRSIIKPLIQRKTSKQDSTLNCDKKSMTWKNSIRKQKTKRNSER